MMAPVVRHRRRNTPSASGRHSDRFTDPIHGLESLDSGPPRLPVEPACVLDPTGGGAHALDRARPGTDRRRRYGRPAGW